MTSTQKLKWAILLASGQPEFNPGEAPTPEQVEELYQQFTDTDDHYDTLSESRGGELETDIESEYSRHYSSRSVAAKMPDGSWIGWTYFYGGGKHGEPGTMPWIEDAYDLECKEEEKLVVVRTWAKKG